MAKTIHFKIATPERVVYKADVEQITLPTMMGEITVLPEHIPLISVLRSGELLITKNGEVIPLAVSGGFIEVLADKVIVLADTAERVEDLDIERAKTARKRAEEALKKKRYDAKEYAVLTARIEKELARIRVVKKYRIKTAQKGLGERKYNE